MAFLTIQDWSIHVHKEKKRYKLAYIFIPLQTRTTIMSTNTIVKLEESNKVSSKKRNFKDEDVTSMDDDGLEIVQVTPSPKKRTKGKNEVILVNVKKAGRPVNVYKEPRTILTMGREDGANVLAVIPGGYTDHYRCFRYIRLLHGHLSRELKAWIENVLNFVRDIERDALNLFNVSRARYIRNYVMKKVGPLKKYLDTNDGEIVVHALNLTAIKANFQCDDKQAKLLFYLCAGHEFQLKFKPDMEGDENTYEIYTLFSHGRHWNFGEE